MRPPNRSRDSTDRFDRLDRAFDRAVDRMLDSVERVTLLYSGGVDSSILAAELLPRVETELLVVGFEGSTDPDSAREGAACLGAPVRVAIATEEELRRVADRLAPIVGPRPEPSRSVLLTIGLAVRASRDPLVVVGQGADELFGGYAHFRGLGAAEAEARRGVDLAQLRDEEWPLSESVAQAFDRELRAPYLDAEFGSAALALTLPVVGGRELTKPVLREWARHRGLPEPIVQRPKRAMQYGSGVARRVDRLGLAPSLPGGDGPT